MVSIDTIENTLDGVHATVTVTGTPNGALSFAVCRVPEFGSSAPATAALVSGSTYYVAVPFPALWYIWAVDNDGEAVPGACWVCNTNDPDLRSCGEKIASILNEHKPGINAALYEISSSTTVKQILFGRALNIDDFPAIIVGKPRKQERYIGLPFIREVIYQFEIAFALFHQDEGSLLAVATSIVDRITPILNLPVYSSLVLDTGTPITGCIATEGEATEEEIEEKRWVAVATVVWTAQGLIEDTGALS